MPSYVFLETESVHRVSVRSESVRYSVRREPARDQQRFVESRGRRLEQLYLRHYDEVGILIRHSQIVRTEQVVLRISVIRIRVVGKGSREHAFSRNIRASVVLEDFSGNGISQVSVDERPVRDEVRVGRESYVEEFSRPSCRTRWSLRFLNLSSERVVNHSRPVSSGHPSEHRVESDPAYGRVDEGSEHRIVFRLHARLIRNT